MAGIEAIKRWVEAGDAVTFLSERAVEREVAQGLLTARSLSDLDLHRWFLLVRRSESFATAAAQVAHRFLRQAVREGATRQKEG